MTSTPPASRSLPWWRRGLPIPVAAAFAMVGITFSPIGEAPQSPGPPLAMAFLALMLLAVGGTVAALLAWRATLHRTIMAVTALAAALLPLTPMPALLCLPGFIDRAGPLTARRTRLELGLGIGGTLLAATVAAVRDAAAEHAAGSLTMTVIAGDGDPMRRVEVPLWVSLVSIVLPVGLAVGIGAMRRVIRSGRSAEARSAQLDDELARRAEREALSREVHDALGHRLSLLNLQAGALEAQASDDPRLAEQAAQLRENASQSMGDLRSLLDELDRGPVPLPLAEIHRIVDASVRPADAVRIEADEHAIAPPELARASVRIVQECLTNARKHAPQSALRLEVTGRPGDGLHIRCSNWLAASEAPDGPAIGAGPSSASRSAAPPAAAPPAGSGRGLPSIAERARRLGGTCICGPAGAEFRVHVALPWPAPV